MRQEESITAADLRAELARNLVHTYQIAPLVGLHPNHLSQVLRGRRALTQEMAKRIMKAIHAQTRTDPS